MTDNTSIPTPDPTSWLAQELVFVRLCDSIRPANKVALFEVLAQAGITTVIVEFDGYGDNGQIEDVTAQAGDKVTDLPALNLEIARAEWGCRDPARVAVDRGSH